MSVVQPEYKIPIWEYLPNKSYSRLNILDFTFPANRQLLQEFRTFSVRQVGRVEVGDRLKTTEVINSNDPAVELDHVFRSQSLKNAVDVDACQAQGGAKFHLCQGQFEIAVGEEETAVTHPLRQLAQQVRDPLMGVPLTEVHDPGTEDGLLDKGRLVKRSRDGGMALQDLQKLVTGYPDDPCAG